MPDDRSLNSRPGDGDDTPLREALRALPLASQPPMTTTAPL